VVQHAPQGLPSADITVTQRAVQGATPSPSQGIATVGFAMRRGEIVEFRLAATIRWGVSMQNSAILTPHQSNDWYDASGQVCVWRYTAAATGMAHLTFEGGLVCPPNTACPALAAIAQYEVTVESDTP
jgi:hypothetical protein